jgi:hypothetical protein
VPTTSVNYVSSPDTRGTLDIVWSCIFTIFACTWTIQHLNVPEQRDRDPEKKGRLWAIWYWFKWEAKGFWTQFKWMIATMLAPELILGKAIGEFAASLKMKSIMKKYTSDTVKWGLSHGFFANMGGFRAIPPRLKDPQAENSARPDLVVTGWDGNVDAETQTRSNPIPLTAILIWALRTETDNGEEKSMIKNLPEMATAEIHDKSKSDFFVKAVAVIQIFWVFVQVIVRSAKGLAVSQLELVVTAFSVCAILTYICLIPKPQGVRVPVEVEVKPHDLKVVIKKLDTSFYLRQLFIPGFRRKKVRQYTLKWIPNDTLHLFNSKVILSYAVGFSLGGVIFGAIHIAGWNLEFPTQIDQQPWRISSVLMTTLMPFCVLRLFLGSLYPKGKFSIWKFSKRVIPVQALALVCGLVYFAARLVILVEIFRTLAYLPPDAFISTWASNIPHVG